MTARANRIPRLAATRPGLLARAHRALLLRWLTWRADLIRAERRQYEEAGAAGPVYLRNSLTAELALRLRVRRLEGLL